MEGTAVVPPSLLPGADTAGTGVSLLARVASAATSRAEPSTRTLLALKFSKSSSVGDVERLVTASSAPTASGLCVVLGGAALLFVEQSCEATAVLVRRLATAAEAAKGDPTGRGTLLTARVLVSVEDCPARLFGPLAVRGMAGAAEPPAAAAAAGGGEPPHKAAISLYKHFAALADKLAADSAALGGGGEAGRVHASLLEALDRYAGLLPTASEGRVEVLAGHASLTTLQDWVGLYASAAHFDAGAEEVLPLPTRVPY